MIQKTFWGRDGRARAQPTSGGLIRGLLWLGLLLGASGTPLTLYAHASLISSEPAQGAVLSTPPTLVQLHFDEPVAPLLLKLVHPDGDLTELPLPEAHGETLHIALPTVAVNGRYALSWRVVSADGHPIGATLAFAVGQATTAAQPTAAPPNRARTVSNWAALWARYSLLMAAIGLALARVLAPGLHQQRALGRSVAALAAIACVSTLGLLGVDALDLPLRGLLQTASWRAAIHTSQGLATALALLSLGFAALLWRNAEPRASKAVALLMLLALGGSFAVSGHASTAAPQLLARPGVWMHAVAATLWIGLLLPLWLTLRAPTDKTALLRLFSRGIGGVLLLLLGSGVLLAVLQLPSLNALWQSRYGQVLIAKLLLVTLLLGIGAYNRYRLTAPALGGDVRAQQRLRWLLGVDLALALLLLAVVALWRFTPPPRAPSAEPPPAASVHLHSEQAMAQLGLWHAAQADRLRVQLWDADMQPLPAQAVEVVFIDPKQQIEPLRYRTRAPQDSAGDSAGNWVLTDFQLPAKPQWQVQLHIQVSDFKRITLSAMLALDAPSPLLMENTTP